MLEELIAEWHVLPDGSTDGWSVWAGRRSGRRSAWELLVCKLSELGGIQSSGFLLDYKSPIYAAHRRIDIDAVAIDVVYGMVKGRVAAVRVSESPSTNGSDSSVELRQIKVSDEPVWVFAGEAARYRPSHADPGCRPMEFVVRAYDAAGKEVASYVILPEDAEPRLPLVASGREFGGWTLTAGACHDHSCVRFGNRAGAVTYRLRAGVPARAMLASRLVFSNGDKDFVGGVVLAGPDTTAVDVGLTDGRVVPAKVFASTAAPFTLAIAFWPIEVAAEFIDVYGPDGSDGPVHRVTAPDETAREAGYVWGRGPLGW
jgi:hypothetical protein